MTLLVEIIHELRQKFLARRQTGDLIFSYEVVYILYSIYAFY